MSIECWNEACVGIISNKGEVTDYWSYPEGDSKTIQGDKDMSWKHWDGDVGHEHSNDSF